MMTSRTVAELISGLPIAVAGAPDTLVRSVTYNSRQVEPGALFVAVPGFVHDGFDFVPEAVARGAVAVLSERSLHDLTPPRPSCWGQTEAVRRCLAEIACRWYEHPSRRLDVIGVTGTNGKTTVTALIEDIASRVAPAGRWSTTRVRIGGESFPTPRTTPEAPELQAALAGMLAAGCTRAVVEVSSHALCLDRVAGTRFCAAVFTNLSPDHLDFHKTMDAYFDAKAGLFEGLLPDAPAVINGSDPRGLALAARTSGRAITYGWADAQEPTDYTIRDARPTNSGMRLALSSARGVLEFESPLFGRANAENIAAAAVAALEIGLPADCVAAAVASFGGEPGRLEPIDGGQPFAVLVDFAHTPAALEAAIDAASSRVAPGGRMIVVFGCGGDRDRAKRPMMGRIATERSDLAILTSDNPRSESPSAIIEDVRRGIDATSRARVAVEPDREAAIRHAIEDAQAGDCVLIAGKGHETSQVFADRIIPFDDRQQAAAVLASLAPREARR